MILDVSVSSPLHGERLINDSDKGEGRKVDGFAAGFVVDVVVGADNSSTDTTLSAMD